MYYQSYYTTKGQNGALAIMYNSMTFFANRKYKQWFVVIWMMVLFASMETADNTSLSIRSFQFTISDCISNLPVCFYLFLVAVIELLVFSMYRLFSFLGSVISFTTSIVSIFTFLSLSIFFLCLCLALLTLVKKSILSCATFRKFGSGLELLAGTTSFCYSWFRHGFFLIKKLCLEPLQTQYLCGSFYNNIKQTKYKEKKEIL